jgi:hypothetical protein
MAHLTAPHGVQFPEWPVMRISEYEERFQRAAPSWHQILMVDQSLKPAPRRRRRYLVIAALIAVMTITLEIASHRAAHSHRTADLRASGLLMCSRAISGVFSSLFETAGQERRFPVRMLIRNAP